MGRTAKGVRGMRVTLLANQGIEDEDTELEDDSQDDQDNDSVVAVSRVVSLVVAPQQGEILCACERGFGKRTPVSDFPVKGRGGKGIIAIKTTARNGELVQALAVTDADDIVLISDAGTLVRTPVRQIAQTGRNAQGVTLIRISQDESLVSIALVEGGSEDELDEDSLEAALADNIAQDSADLRDSADLQDIELSEALQQDGLLEADAQQLDD